MGRLVRKLRDRRRSGIRRPDERRADPARILITPGYWRKERRFDSWTPHGVRARVGATHLPVSDLLNALTAAGLTIERALEAGNPVPDILAVRCRRA